jgi:hypothetical protein
MRTLVMLLLFVLTRNGNLYTRDDHNDLVAGAHGIAVAIVGKQLVVLTEPGTMLMIDGGKRRVPVKPADLVSLAGGDTALWARTANAVVRIDLANGKRTTVLELPRLHRIAAEGASVFAEADGVVVEVGTDRKWKVAGRPIALAAGDGKLYVATKEGPLWEVDRATSQQRNLGLGDWWGTIALAYSDHALFAVTVAGKLWRIDPQQRQKTIVAMDGYQGAIDLAVLR